MISYALKTLEILEIKEACPLELQLSGHPQLVKVRVLPETEVSDWVSGAWFMPA